MKPLSHLGGRPQRVLPSLALCLLLVHLSSATCFLPNGTDRNTVGGASPGHYLPCDNAAEVSMCCAIGRVGSVDRCLPGGLCRSADGSTYWRESCTDKTWKSKECLKLFVQGKGFDQDVDLSLCDNGSWCVGNNQTGRHCCQQDQGLFINLENGMPTKTEPKATNSSSPAGTASVTSSASPSGSSTSMGTKVGIGVGVGLGVIVILALVGTMVMIRRRRSGSQEIEPPEMKQEQFQPSMEYDDPLAPPSTINHSMGHFRSESAELDSQTTISGKDRYSYLWNRAPGLPGPPVELPSEGTPYQPRNAELP